MRIVLWIGNESNQKALANKIHEKFQIAGIVTESRVSKRKLTLKIIIQKIYEKLFLKEIGRSWFGMLSFYNKKFPAYPDVPRLDVENINSENVFDFTTELKPDLVVVSGTRMIKKKLLSIKPTIGILNLHTGLSPYIKGAPNCTNWCIATGQYHMIGNTVMWIDEGIDSGNLMATEFTVFNGDESLAELHIKVMEHAHDLYIRSIESIRAGVTNNVRQVEIAEGITYYNKQWGLKEKKSLLKNLPVFRAAHASGKVIENRRSIKVIHINNE